MAKPSNGPGALQVGEDRDWQERFWTAQRVGWVLMALLVLGALLGLTGKGGPLASATARAPGVSVDYPRITRWQSDEEIRLRLPESTTGQAEVLLSPSFSRLFSINSIVPEPARSQAASAGHVFTFETERDGGGKSVTFNVTAGRPVLGQNVEARVGDSEPARMTVTVLP